MALLIVRRSAGRENVTILGPSAAWSGSFDTGRSHHMPLECIATTLSDALAIEENGGDRIELVSCLEGGGFTPSDGLVRAVLAAVRIPVAVMLRPSQPSFFYDENQLSVMRNDALRFRELGVRHIVTGILDENGIADTETLARVLEGTDFQITFHRAIDESSDIAASLERINLFPRVTHILTSLGRGHVCDNLDRLPWYFEHARPRLILGSGVTHENISRILRSALAPHVDLHIGTALRFGSASNPVDAASLAELSGIVNRGASQISAADTGRGRSLEETRAAFKDAAYGLFIHFGLYSLLGGEYGGRATPFLAEWIRLTLDIPDDAYRALAQSFDPSEFNADSLCDRAKGWGMKYLCLTAKHHDGFALFDSAADPFNSVAKSPCGRDFVRELSEACARHGLLFCLYYSQAQDWDHPGGLRAYRDAPGSEAFTRYLEEKCLPQLRELLTQYGPVAMIWLDTPINMTREECARVKALIRSLQPACLISGRIGSGLGDYLTAGDNMMPRSGMDRLWELPATLNRSWGFRKSDDSWRTPQDVILQLTKTVSRGGNLLLNIGPDGTGAVPEPSGRILDEVGAFLKRYGDAFYRTAAIPDYPYEQDQFILTARPRRVYIHLFRRPADETLWIYHIENKPLKAREMFSGETLTVTALKDLEGNACWRVDLDDATKSLDAALSRWGSAVIEVETEEKTLRLSGF